MQSKIAAALNLRYAPVAIILTDEKPEKALQFKEDRWGCVAAMFGAAVKGRTAVFDRRTFGCLGGGTGLGFGNQYAHFPGGIEYFISTGNKDFFGGNREAVRTGSALVDGERYVKSPGIGRRFLESLPITDVPATYVVFKNLGQVNKTEVPEVIVFLANADQLSALTVMAHYERGSGPAVVAPFGAGCHTLFLFPFAEKSADKPRAVIGMTDISARKYLDKDLLSFAVTYGMFLEMENNVEESFLQKKTWLKVLARNRKS